MRPDQWELVKRLFHDALARPAEQRHGWLAQACDGDTEVAAEVERLVAAHLAAGSFIQTPVADLHGDPRERARRARSGSWMGQYRLDALVGIGGMGEVYQALDSSLGRTVAIKIVGHDEAASHERLRREARHASGLNHPNICTIHHVADSDGQPFIVMEFVEGRSLGDTIPPRGLPIATAVTYADQILDALAHAHAHGLVHRDLKSANVMIRPDGRVKLLDFGLARRVEAAAATPGPLSAGSTDRSAMGGTLPYMAPEMLRGQPADARTDLWAFGVLLYEMVTGHLPFARRTDVDLSSAILNDPPASFPPNVPASLRALILCCLEKDPADRYQDAAQVKVDLRVVGETDDRRPGRLRWRSAKALTLAATVLLAVAAISGWRWRQAAAAATPAPRIHALAVLPLENLSPDRSQDYFADGMTEELITELGRTPGLRVISRTTAMRYRGANKSLSEVAKELKVDGLVEGSVVHEGNTVRVAARLFDSSDEQLWTGTFERPFRDVLVLRRELVRAIVHRVGSTSATADDGSVPVRSVDPDVYEAYLKGRYYWNKRTPESLATAVEQFRAATAADPTYAPAYVGLADCYNQMGTVMVAQASPARMRPLAVAAAIAALQIDSTLGEAHAALAYTRHYDWQWEAAGNEFRRAIELSPNNALAHIWYANYLASLMRLDEAVAQVLTARQLDPLSMVVQTNVGWTMAYAGRSDQAIDAYRAALALDPDYVQAHSRLAAAYEHLGRFDAALAEEQTVVRLSKHSASSLLGLAIMYAQVGRRHEAEALLPELVGASRAQYLPPFGLAQVYVRLGDYDRTFECLERAYAERSNGMVYLNVDDVFAAVRSDPRYQSLLRRVGLVP